ncbi:MAG: hypothetical protein A2W90_10355 [Bacteroidetes bacterium GWF2_42_66]|nr:MAG: hypothetical protein A2W92_24050 [Bacteroidetes bacterium GWA2_42_15]OFY01508.1 MAG: hypothetical protein A2W89_02160 [Bacteroidetes bacterium GWE2_42_39]OFY43311.1 MAG: hypothetical protein A2W90_10355 [Bacteroidetes bacterium GWF2_42_66]HBL77506.1 hypothetical protein [Prolixibacteraceae bacterium]HCU61711.1 hypothetical protein [Prolixibacteraceae bacterium]
MKTLIQTVLIAVALLIAYLVYTSIQDPIDFEKAKSARYEATIARLKDIRKAELAYKDVNGKFTGNWDSLVTFVKKDSLILVKKYGMLTDSMLDAGLTEAKALKQGLIIRDTLKVSVLDSLFGKSYPIEKIKYVPVSDTIAEFHLGATVITTGSGINVPVFEAKAHNNTILINLDRQLVINLNDQKRTNQKYPGLKVGSLTETNNNAGNWE